MTRNWWRAIPLAILSLSGTVGAQAGRPEEGKRGPARLVIRPLNEAEWECDLPDVEKVLYSAAGELWRYFPERQLPPIEVTAKGGPNLVLERGPEGQIRVRLETGKRLWAQMAFQFAWAFTRILCNPDAQHASVKWFEDALCEAGSLFALRRMAVAWLIRPPAPNWRDHARHLRSYADDRVKNARLAEGRTLAQWYEDNAAVLRAKGFDVERSAIVAAGLLPLFEAEPQHWQAIAHLNDEQFPGDYTFADYLRAWHRHCPEKDRAFVARIAQQFGMNLRTRRAFEP